MRVVIWITEETWRACVRHALQLLPAEAEVTLLHVASSDVEELAAGGPAGLLGRRRPRRPPADPDRDLRTISDEEARQVLDAARDALGRDCTTVARHGRVEREVVAACADADLLVAARDGQRKLGPKSLGPRARFIVDHAPCTVVLVWAQAPPGTDTIPPPPDHDHEPGLHHGPHHHDEPPHDEPPHDKPPRDERP